MNSSQGISRTPRLNQAKHFYEFGPFRIDPDRRILLRGESPIALQPRAFDVLLTLVQNSEKVVSKDDLMKAVWPDTFVEEANLAQHIFVLRKTLGETKRENRYILTVPGRGYRFAAKVNIVQERDGEKGTLCATESEWADQASEGRSTDARIRQAGTVWSRLAIPLALGALVIVGFSLARWVPRINRLVSGRRAQSHTSLPDEVRIAVLPLDVVGNDETVRPLADGLVETISSKLSQMEGFQGKLMVVPASEVRIRHITSAEAARKIYGANLAITGSAQQWKDRIQFTLNLIDTATVQQIDSRSFDFDAGNPIILRDKVTNGAMEMLALKLTPEAEGSILEGETSVPEAYAEYLKGIGYLAQYGVRGNLDHAIESLTEATRSDPGYARAFAALGRAQWFKAVKENDPQGEKDAVNTTLESIHLAPRLAEGHVRLGEIYAGTGRVQEAIQEEWNALRLAPGNAEAYKILGNAYSANGQYDQAEAVYREAVRKQPEDWNGFLLLGLFYRDRGRYAEAHAAFDSALKLAPSNEVVYRNVAALDMREGKFREASDMIAKALAYEPVAKTYMTLGTAYYFQRRYVEAAAAFHSGIQLDPSLYALWGNLGEVYRHLPGNEQKSREALRQAIMLAEKHLATVQSDDNTRASLAEYWANLGEREKALEQIAKIPQQSRAVLADRIVPTYELLGDRHRAVEMVRMLSPNDPILAYVRNHPDLESLWRDPALQPLR
jgi:tetratricopeptide (TPR) repeat protein/DNA-binding winged helix-turn-helix (wHTH) protein